MQENLFRNPQPRTSRRGIAGITRAEAQLVVSARGRLKHSGLGGSGASNRNLLSSRVFHSQTRLVLYRVFSDFAPSHVVEVIVGPGQHMEPESRLCGPSSRPSQGSVRTRRSDPIRDAVHRRILKSAQRPFRSGSSPVAAVRTPFASSVNGSTRSPGMGRNCRGRRGPHQRRRQWFRQPVPPRDHRLTEPLIESRDRPAPRPRAHTRRRRHVDTSGRPNTRGPTSRWHDSRSAVSYEPGT